MSRSASDADVIVFGAGAGGLTTAAYLAALGRRVIVVDRQPMAGGNTSSFTHEGYEFDIGLHYLGGYRDARPGVRAVLDPLGIELSFHEQDRDGFDTLLFEDMTFAVPADVEQFKARLHERFPRERGAIDRYLRRVVAIAEQLEEPVPSRLAEVPCYAWRAREFLAASMMTVSRELDRLDCSPRLRTVLSYLWGTYAVPPSRAALGMHAAVTLHYLRGAWYPEGGARSVSDALVGVIERNGGELLLDTDVYAIIVDGGAVRGVRVRPGPGGSEPRARELFAPTVVSAVDIKRTFGELLDAEHVPDRLRRRVRAFTMAHPLFIVYLVLDRDLRAEGVPNRNFSVIDCDDIDSMAASFERGQLPAQRWAWITSASLKDPENPRLCRPGQTNLQIVMPAPASHDYWDVDPELTRGPRYEERKQALRDRAIESAERAIPGIGAAIAYEETATPISLERHLRSTGGTSYGIAATPRQFGIGRPAPRTPIHGLFLAGASTRSGHGITGTMLGGVEAASAIIGERADEIVRPQRTPPKAPAPERQLVG
ncbi:MAG TPA: NAD(P)/FAD-dependent oxidoreductase [Solirubrobacteraceae bacterium]|nr:NAD(P)/FAD-dependent oxidoreductase [Solirubrobacteraceae bacterium]